MVYKPHIKIVFRGEFTGTPEEWSFSTKWRQVLDLDNDADINNIDATGIRNALVGLFSDTTAPISSTAKCTGWRAYSIGPDGKMVGNPRIEEFAVADYIPGAVAAKYPPQVALCITTEANNRGPARFGRFYLPSPAAALQNDYRISATAQAAYLVRAVTFLQGVRDSIDIPNSLATATMVHASPTGSGVEQPVTKVRVGKTLDTIRRRRFQLLEEYVENTDVGLDND